MDVIEPAQAELTSSIVSVRKKHRTDPTFLNCCKLNRLTIWDSHFTPRKDKYVDSLGS